MKHMEFTALLQQEGDGYVSLCPELDVASQGDTVEEALKNLKEAVSLFLETAGKKEIQQRLKGRVFVTHFEAAYA